MTGLVQGKNCVLQFDQSGAYATYGCAKEFTLETTSHTKKVRTVGDGKWGKSRLQSLDYVLSFASLIKLTDAATPKTFDTYWAQINGTHLRFQLIYQEMDTLVMKVIRGTALPSQSTITASATGFANCSFTLEGFGAPELLDATTTCTAAIGTVTITGAAGNKQADLSGVTGSPFRYDYTIDGGTTIYTAFGEPFLIASPGQVAGSHTLVITPLCTNGFGGTPKTQGYTV